MSFHSKEEQGIELTAYERTEKELAEIAFDYLDHLESVNPIWGYSEPVFTFAGFPMFLAMAMDDTTIEQQIMLLNPDVAPAYLEGSINDETQPLVFAPCTYKFGIEYLKMKLDDMSNQQGWNEKGERVLSALQDIVENLVLKEHIDWTVLSSWIFRIALLLKARSLQPEKQDIPIDFEQAADPYTYDDEFVKLCMVALSPAPPDPKTKLSISGMLTLINYYHEDISLITAKPWADLMFPDIIPFLESRRPDIGTPGIHFAMTGLIAMWKDQMIFKQWNFSQTHLITDPRNTATWGHLRLYGNRSFVRAFFPTNPQTILSTDMRYVAALEAQLRHAYKKSKNHEYAKKHKESIFLTNKYHLVFAKTDGVTYDNPETLWNAIQYIYDPAFQDMMTENHSSEEFTEVISSLLDMARPEL